MTIYHLSISPVSRKTGRSATASAAYCSAEKIVDERTQVVHDYTRKRGVVHTEIVLPRDAPAWARQRAALWNAVEQHNRRADAVVARSMTLALPHELTDGQRQQLISGFARHIADRYQIGVDVAIHRPSGPDERNHHAHLLLTSNRLGAMGLGTKARELDPIAQAKAGPGENAAEQLRQAWEQHANRALALAGHAQRIDHRTLEAQGIDHEPTQHLGPAATEYERRTGKPSRRRLDSEAYRDGWLPELDWVKWRLTVVDRDLRSTTADLEAAQRQWERREAMINPAWKRPASERQDPPARAEPTPPVHRQPTAQEQEQARIERMTAKELAAEIQRLTPPAVEDVLSRHSEIMAARHTAWQLSRELAHTRIAAYRAQREAATWRDAHPIRAQLHNAGIKQPYLAKRERIMQREQALQQEKEQAYQQAHQLADRLRSLIEAEQAPARMRLAELETLRQAKMAQEQVQERLQAARPRGVTHQGQERSQVAQKPLQTTSQPRAALEHQERSQSAQERHQAAPSPQPLPPPTLEQTAAQKPLQTPPAPSQVAPPQPSLSAAQQAKADALHQAVETLDKRSAMLRFPELIQLYPLVARAAHLAEERLSNAEQRAAFVEGIKERGIRELAQGKTLPSLSHQHEPQKAVEREQEQDYGPEP